MRRALDVVGGGVAGLALGISLRRAGVPVRVWEAGRYPRHRVCGEVLSGRGCEVLGQLGLWEAIRENGAPARTAIFFNSQGRRTPRQSMDGPSVCVSRKFLDHLMAERFRELGGELREGDRWASNDAAEGVVRATGRTIQTVASGWQWFGLKAHCRNVELMANVEMHLSRLGYIGLCRVGGGEINVCGLFRRRAGRGERSDGRRLLRGAPGSSLEARLKSAKWDAESFCAVAGLPLRPGRTADSGQCRIGDAFTMIPPVTGNGMSMALEAAELAGPPLAAYWRGELNWNQARARVSEACHARFSRRLRWARWVHPLLFSDLGQCVALAVSRHFSAWRAMFHLTR